jgi:hypothetical protein
MNDEHVVGIPAFGWAEALGFGPDIGNEWTPQRTPYAGSLRRSKSGDERNLYDATACTPTPRASEKAPPVIVT